VRLLLLQVLLRLRRLLTKPTLPIANAVGLHLAQGSAIRTWHVVLLFNVTPQVRVALNWTVGRHGVLHSRAIVLLLLLLLGLAR
jgi:hypothetical protein